MYIRIEQYEEDECWCDSLDSNQSWDCAEGNYNSTHYRGNTQNIRKHSSSSSSASSPDQNLNIQLRNARERNRVRAVNDAFSRLRKIIPYTAHRSKRVSKVKTLQKAVQYIAELRALLNSIGAHDE